MKNVFSQFTEQVKNSSHDTNFFSKNLDGGKYLDVGSHKVKIKDIAAVPAKSSSQSPYMCFTFADANDKIIKTNIFLLNRNGERSKRLLSVIMAINSDMQLRQQYANKLFDEDFGFITALLNCGLTIEVKEGDEGYRYKKVIGGYQVEYKETIGRDDGGKDIIENTLLFDGQIFDGVDSAKTAIEGHEEYSVYRKLFNEVGYLSVDADSESDNKAKILAAIEPKSVKSAAEDF